MNQLTVMLNGNGPSGPQQSHAPSQFFTFTGQPTMNAQGATTITLDQQQQQQAQQLGASHQSQLVTFQSQPQAGTMMLAGSQAYSGAQPGMTHQTQGAIQYIITQPQQPTQQPMLAPTQSQFGIVQNLLGAPGMGGMIPVNQQQLATNGTIQIPTQTLMAPNGTLQPSFLTMAPNQPTFQIQNPTNGTTQLFHHQPQQSQQQQFQLQAPSMTGSAITITNPSGQFVHGPGGQQFVFNQNISQANGQTNLMTTNQGQPSPIYQLVLPNGQVLQTMQSNPTSALISPQLLQSTGMPQQPTAITVPIQAAQNGQTMNILAAPNLTLTSGQTTTFITQPNASNMQSGNTTILGSHQSPSLHSQHHQNGLVIATPSSSSTTQQSLLLSTSPQIHHQASNQQQQSLLIPVSSSSQQANTTAMVVLTQSNGSVIPNAVLDQKSLQQSSPQHAVVLLTSPKVRGSPSQGRVSAKPSAGSTTIVTSCAVSASSDAVKQSATVSAAPSTSSKITISPVIKVKPIPCDQATQCDDHPQISKLLESIPEEEESQSSESTQQDQATTANTSPSEPERPSRPSSASSCGSLKIAEDEVAEEEEEEIQRDNDNDTENNDAFSTETEVDNSPANDAENEQISHTATDEVNETSASEQCDAISGDQRSQTGKAGEDKDGYQSSYGSPCHFTDTEDEEEEEMELGNCDAIDGEQEIKLVRKNGLTKAAYDLINNRLLGSDCGEDQTTNDSKSSFTSTAAERLDEAEEEEEQEQEETSNDSNAFMQTPSPSGSNASAQMEPESTTHNLAATKEKTITNIQPDIRFYNGIDLEPIRNFAREFKHFRLTRGLTQSHVCQDLQLKTDGQSYSQSAICRFEKLDITPKSAVKIKPVLENWLRASKERYPHSKINSDLTLVEAVKERTSAFANIEAAIDPNSKCSNSEDETISSLNHCVSLEPGKKRKKRTSFTPEQLDALNHFFEKTPKPSSEEMTEIAKLLGSHDPKINRDVVRVWFCNKRQALKAKRPNQMDSPTPQATAASSGESKSTSGSLVNSKVASAYSLPQPLGPIEAPKLVNLSSSRTGGINANLLASTGALPFPFASPVSAIPLALSNSSPSTSPASTAATVPKSTALMRTSLPSIPQSSALNLAHLKSISTPIITSFTSSGNKPSTITTFKMERAD